MARDEQLDELDSHDYDPDDVDELPADDLDDDAGDYEDFDAFWAQHTATEKRERVRVMGQLVPVPLDMTIEMQQRIERADVDADDEIRDIVAELFGADLLDDWIAGGMTTRQFGVLLAWAMLRAQGQNMSFADVMSKIKDKQQGKATGPNRQQRRAAASRQRSRGTGGRSSRTSAANTGSRRAR